MTEGIVSDRSISEIAVVIPTYNNAATIGAVISGITRFCGDIIVVDDGSTDDTQGVLEKYERLTVIRFPKNLGKGCALRAGMDKAAEMGFTHVISVDGDGQHVPEDAALFMERIREDPSALLVGNRMPSSSGSRAPLRSRFGRKFGNFWYRFNTGITLHDTQCGLRAYPLAAMRELNVKGKRYEFEQDALIKAAWNGIAVHEVDIRLSYHPEASRVSHFRPVRDFLRISVVNAKAGFVRVAFPVLTFDAPGRTLGEKVRAVVRHELRAHTTPKRAAFSVALGVFMGIFPIHGFQVASLMGLALVLRLNRPLAFLGVCVSSPPFLPFLVIAAVAVGRLLVPSDLITQSAPSTAQVVLQGGAEFVAGSAALAVVCGICTYVFLYPLFVHLRKNIALVKKVIRR